MSYFVVASSAKYHLKASCPPHPITDCPEICAHRALGADPGVIVEVEWKLSLKSEVNLALDARGAPIVTNHTEAYLIPSSTDVFTLSTGSAS